MSPEKNIQEFHYESPSWAPKTKKERQIVNRGHINGVDQKVGGRRRCDRPSVEFIGEFIEDVILFYSIV